MKTSDKVFVPIWLIVMFSLIFAVSANSFNKTDQTKESASVEESPIVDTIENIIVLEDMQFVIPEKEPRIPIYGSCGPAQYDRKYREPVDQIEYDEELVMVADPLYGKDLYIFYIAQIVEQYYPDVDPYIVLAVLETESRYKPDVQSKAGAIGLMQVIPKYHAWRVEQYGLNDLWDPYTNIICGVDLLNELYSKRGSWQKALLGYNNSMSYVNYVIKKADNMRKDGYFG